MKIRSMREAIEDGDTYQVTHPFFCRYGYWPPAAQSPDEVMAWMAQWATAAPDGTIFSVDHVLRGTTIGRMMVSDAGEIRLLLAPHAIETMAAELQSEASEVRS